MARGAPVRTARRGGGEARRPIGRAQASRSPPGALEIDVGREQFEQAAVRHQR